MIFIRLNRSWVRFPQAAQIRPPGFGWAFLCALMGRAAWCARGRRPAREIATREPAARSGRSRSPARPRRRPRAPQPGPVGQAAWLSETAVTFAGAGRASAETGVAFAGEQRAFLVRFSVAVVSSVSTVAIQGRAVVMVVSSSPRHSCPCVKKFALLGLMLGVSATKFAQRAQNGPNSAFCGVLGEFFAEMLVEGRRWASYFAPTGAVVRSCRRCGALLAGCDGGFAPCEAL